MYQGNDIRSAHLSCFLGTKYGGSAISGHDVSGWMHFHASPWQAGTLQAYLWMRACICYIRCVSIHRRQTFYGLKFRSTNTSTQVDDIWTQFGWAPLILSALFRSTFVWFHEIFCDVRIRLKAGQLTGLLVMRWQLILLWCSSSLDECNNKWWENSRSYRTT